MRSFEPSAPSPSGRGTAPRRESAGSPRRGAKKQWSEEKPKRPIQVRTTGRIYDVEGDDSGEDVEVDNFATSLNENSDDDNKAGDE